MTGAPQKTYPEISTFIDNIGQMDDTLPSPRIISNTIFGNPPPSTTLTSRLNQLHMYVGQTIAHDVIASVAITDEKVDIKIPQGDPFFDPFSKGDVYLPFFRSNYTGGTSESNQRKPINLISSYVDCSFLYGSSAERLNILKDFDSPYLTSSVFNDEKYLILNEMLAENDNNAHVVDDSELFLSGDVRVNENPGLSVVHILLHREHNKLVDELKASNPSYSSERLFEEARRRVIAKWQAIVFNEYVTTTLGSPLEPYNGYDDSVDASISIAFGAAAFRYGHSEVSSVIQRRDPENLEKVIEPLLLREAFFNPLPWREDGIESILYASFFQPQQLVDPYFITDLRNFLFGNPGVSGEDLISRNIQRNRDHGVPLLNDYREFVLGLERYTLFDQITSDSLISEALKIVYENNIDRVELYVGGLCEDQFAPASMGETFQSIVRQQYQALRDGDRFYYENQQDSGFTQEEIEEFAAFSLSKLIERNSNILNTDNENVKIPCDALFLIDDQDFFQCGKNISSSSQTISIIGGAMKVSWQLVDNGKAIDFTIVAKTEGWVGLGFSRNGASMLNSDVIIGAVIDSDQSVILEDYDFRQRRVVSCPGVCPDTLQGGTNDVEIISGSQSDGVTTIQFKRLLNTGDPLDYVIDPSEDITMIFAMSPSNDDTLSYHGSNKVALLLNLEDASFDFVEEEDDYDDKVIAHGVLMFVAWCIIFPLGIIIPRFGKGSLLRYWFRLHMGVQYLGVVTVIAALIVIIEAAASRGHDHFENTHSILGLTCIILAIIVPILGQLTSLLWDSGSSDSTSEPFFPHKIHYITGYFTPIFAFITIYFGLDEYDVDWEWYLIVSLWIGIGLITFIIFFIYQMVSRKSSMGVNPSDIASESDEDQNWSSDSDD